MVRLGDVLDTLGIDPDAPADADDFGTVTALICRRTVEPAERAAGPGSLYPAAPCLRLVEP
ncbi:MAG: hypothetical protein EKK42_18710 [Pseudonocardiaceae bacterium]|nr:MAG: hypothetical protein EKK42_18710 [Pseudonocardiaceae bacterium]